MQASGIETSTREETQLQALVRAALALAARRARQMTPADELPRWVGGQWAAKGGC